MSKPQADQVIQAEKVLQIHRAEQEAADRWIAAMDAVEELCEHEEWKQLALLADYALDQIRLSHSDFVAYPALRMAIKAARQAAKKACWGALWRNT